MNKYEKAFNHLREHASFDTVDEMIDIKELVEKAIPKKPLIAFADGSVVQKTALVCPSCKSLLVER
nr:MAG TPA: 24-sterol C-methyltransferase [Caudoviricetes sp.]